MRRQPALHHGDGEGRAVVALQDLPPLRPDALARDDGHALGVGGDGVKGGGLVAGGVAADAAVEAEVTEIRG